MNLATCPAAFARAPVRRRPPPPARTLAHTLPLMLALLAGPAAAAPATLFELAPSNPLHHSTQARGVNNLGQAVGTSWGRISTGGVSFDQLRASVWHTPSAGAVTGLALPSSPVLPGSAAAINDAGQIAGKVGGAVYRWTPDAGPTPGYSAPGLALGSLSAGEHSATAINAQGQVVGDYWKCAATAPDCSLGNTRAWRWGPADGLQPLGPEGGFWTHAQAINNAGDVLVANTTTGNGRIVEIHAAGGSVTPVALGDEVFAQANSMDMNDSRQIAATRFLSAASGPTVRQAFVWSDGVEHALQHLNPSLGGAARAINSQGWVVGEEFLGGGVFAAALWVGSGLVFDLNGLLSEADAEAWTLESALDISDTGWITGNGSYRATPGGDAVQRGWVMQLSAGFIAGLPPGPVFPPSGSPVPLPGTLVLAAVALLAAQRACRRR